ncbi:MAG TPA: molybdenum cofactor biosynthesis protein MoaE [Gammaproteobacteria bacterium]|nr:molybdenum cofactor biosynthesis protein MoaE [Gammaproteobacteria bacterium]
MSVLIREAAFEPWTELAAYERSRFPARGGFGACASFVGTMRDLNEGDSVAAMTLEHYPGMTERHLQAICAEAQARWALLDTLVIHRVGRLAPGDPIVLVAAWSAHRAEAFTACRHIMEDLKSKAPFWKKETTADGERWVAHNTAGVAVERARES